MKLMTPLFTGFMPADFFRQTDGSAEIKCMDTILPRPRLTSSDRSRSVAPTEAQGREGIEIIWRDLNSGRRVNHFYPKPPNLDASTHYVEAPTCGH